MTLPRQSGFAAILSLLGSLVCVFLPNSHAQVRFDFSEYRNDSEIRVAAAPNDLLQITWPTAKNVRGEMILDLRASQPLIASLGLTEGQKPTRILATQLDPVTTLTIGARDPKKYDNSFRGMVFFENPRQTSHETSSVELTKKNVRVTSNGPRVSVAIGDVSAGSFTGELQFAFYPNSPLIKAETVVRTKEELRAILYDTGLSSTSPDWTCSAWLDPLGKLQRAKLDGIAMAQPLGAKLRTLVAEGRNGSIAVFPAPHKYFYPLDFADNFQFNWFGSGYSKMPPGFGFGIRQPLDGDKRWVPWFDAPAGKEQHLGVFYLLSTGDGAQALSEAARYTHDDRFKALSGYKTFTSHYHIEHTLDFLDRQTHQKTNSIPLGLETPGFVTKFKATGVDIVHLAEFHQGWTPGQQTLDRLRMLKVMHQECARLSDDKLLLLPGEEPNVHLGGHWISFFPKPVYWVLNRSAGEPFEENIAGYGMVYHVGNPDDVLKLMKKENGLMWTAHARIKGSIPFPDRYRDEPFFKSDHFLGAAWKNLPADLSRPTLGWRVLDLFDEMNLWGAHKQIIGEVDVFKVEPDYELYAHMNINYLKLKHSPKFSEGWRPVLDTLRHGQFFTTTGEILIPKFTVAGKESGETISRTQATKVKLRVDLDWTFPLAFAEVITGNRQSINRERIDLSSTESFGTRTFHFPVALTDQDWIRLEVWDVAANGAFTQPVWVK